MQRAYCSLLWGTLDNRKSIFAQHRRQDVESHMFRIMDQLDLHSTVALAKHAIVEGLVSR